MGMFQDMSRQIQELRQAPVRGNAQPNPVEHLRDDEIAALYRVDPTNPPDVPLSQMAHTVAVGLDLGHITDQDDPVDCKRSVTKRLLKVKRNVDNVERRTLYAAAADELEERAVADFWKQEARDLKSKGCKFDDESRVDAAIDCIIESHKVMNAVKDDSWVTRRRAMKLYDMLVKSFMNIKVQIVCPNSRAEAKQNFEEALTAARKSERDKIQNLACLDTCIRACITKDVKTQRDRRKEEGRLRGGHPSRVPRQDRGGNQLQSQQTSVPAAGQQPASGSRASTPGPR